MSVSYSRFENVIYLSGEMMFGVYSVLLQFARYTKRRLQRVSSTTLVVRPDFGSSPRNCRLWNVLDLCHWLLNDELHQHEVFIFGHLFPHSVKYGNCSFLFVCHTLDGFTACRTRRSRSFLCFWTSRSSASISSFVGFGVILCYTSSLWFTILNRLGFLY